jgi:serine protease Do
MFAHWTVFARLVVLALAVHGGLLVGRLSADGDSSTAPMSTTAETVSADLRKLLDGAPPKGPGDLKAMQSHIQRLSEKLKKCTVGVQVRRAWGSGVIISPDGYVLTAAHVAGRPNVDCEITLSDGRRVAGKTLGLYRTLDAGLMKITEPGEYPYAEMGAYPLKEKQWCIALGHPGGYHVDRGAVLRLGRVLHIDRDAVTTSCTLVGGDSGGPLFDMDGRVIGVNSRIAEHLTTNMHVPVAIYKEQTAWDRLVKGEAWGSLPGREPYLGVGGEEASVARIAKVTPNSPAEKSDLRPGDLVLEFNGQKLTDFDSLRRAVADCQPNEVVELRVQRDDQVLAIKVRLERRP